MFRFLIICLLVAAGARVEARDAPKSGPQSATVEQLLACRSIPDRMVRLDCFDRETLVLTGAIMRHDIVVVDRDEVRRTRRTLFGLTVPSMAFLGGDKDDLKQIDGTLSGTSHNRDGGYIFRLEDGSRWTQVDDRAFALQPQAGEKVLVKRATMGSYMLIVGRQPGVRVQRLN